ncbi:Flagellar biosynthesis protein FliQ [hydrothermal vent metagenome]|jgi:flagellar biosynthesis protein FliQ|uniref:Flagellar biosynthesis protein FliQ n=1 Tax=hydrothermal vent metagenome TaxID=652676 RepID=A0A3B0S6X9_9ZZZZ
MSDVEIIGLLREYLWAGVWIASPLLITALVVGIVIGLFQALTSIQELTLTFVPKLVAMLIAFTMCIGFSANLMLSVFHESVIKYIAN